MGSLLCRSGRQQHVTDSKTSKTSKTNNYPNNRITSVASWVQVMPRRQPFLKQPHVPRAFTPRLNMPPMKRPAKSEEQTILDGLDEELQSIDASTQELGPAVEAPAASSQGAPAASSQGAPAAPSQGAPAASASGASKLSEQEIKELQKNDKPDPGLVKRIYSALRSTALAKDPAAEKLYDEINNLPQRGGGKNAKKFLFAWTWYEKKQETGKDFPPEWWEEVQELTITERHAYDGLWLTAGRLSVLLGSEEAQEMITSGEMREKTVNGRKRYFYIEEKQSREATKKRRWKTSGKQELPDGEQARLAFDGLQARAAGFDEGNDEEPAREKLQDASTVNYAVNQGKHGVSSAGADDAEKTEGADADDGNNEEAPSEATTKQSKKPRKEPSDNEKAARLCQQTFAYLQKLQLDTKKTLSKIKDDPYCVRQYKELLVFLNTLSKQAPWFEKQAIKLTESLEAVTRKCDDTGHLQNAFKTLQDKIPKASLA